MLGRMFDDGLRATATSLVRERGRALGKGLTELAREHRAASSQQLIDLLAAASKEERPALGLLLARVILEDAIVHNSPPKLNDFLFRFAVHLKISVSAPGLQPSSRLVLATAAEHAMHCVPTATQAQLNGVSDLKHRFSGPPVDDSDWVGAVGMSANEYRESVDTIATQLRGTHVGEREGKSVGTVRSERPVALGSDADPPATAPEANADSPRTAPPIWLRIDFSKHPDRLMVATVNWDSRLFPVGASSDVVNAWHLFNKRNYIGARSELAGILTCLDEDWGPTSTADGLRFWHWLRLVAELAALDAGEALDRRRTATSSLELALRCLPDDEELLDRLQTAALDDFSASDPASSRAWGAYTVRLIACSNHEIALSGYDNSLKATLRDTWARQYGLSADNARNTATMAGTIADRLKGLTRILYLSARDSLDAARTLIEVERALPPFLDEFESDLLAEACEMMLDAERSIAAETLNHRELQDLGQALSDMGRLIATSGSLLLQDYVAPHVARLAVETRRAENRLGNTSRPDLSVRLESARLPLSAAPGTPYSITIVAANTGNATAERIVVRIINDELGIDSEATLDSLGAGSEDSMELLATATEVAPPAVSLACSLTWSDALQQQFTSSVNLSAEDQRPASWTGTDINPFNLGTISDPSRLVGRDDDLASLEALLAGGGSAYVTGHKRVGKTSLTRVLLRHTALDRGWAGGLLSLGRALGPEQSAADLVYALMDEILSAIRHSYHQAAVGLADIEPDADGNFARTANRWLRKVAEALPADARVVVAIDDFDELPPHLVGGPQADSLFLFLRSIVDEPWLNLIVVGSEILPSVIQGQAHKLNQVVPVSVTNFSSRTSTEALLVPPTKDRLEWEPEAIDRIHHFCRGNPYYETLVAQQLWLDLRERARSFVMVADADAAANGVAKSAPASHFVHLWADSASGIDHTSRRAIVASAVLRAVARCGGTELAPAHSEEVVRVAQTMIQTATVQELHQTINSLVSREVLKLGPSEDSLLMAIPLVSVWLTQAGGRALDREYADSVHATATTRVVTENDLALLSRGLIYRGEHISEIRIQAWLNQFGDHYHQHLAYQMLHRMVIDGYFTASRLHEKVMPKLRDNIATLQASRQILRDNNQQYMKNAYLLDHGVAGDSTQGTLSALCKTLKIKKANVLSASDMAVRLRMSEAGVVVFVLDDYCGSGKHLETSLAELVKELPAVAQDWRERVHIVVGAGIVSEMSRLPISAEDEVTVEHVFGITLGPRFRAFDLTSGVFGTPKEGEDALDLVKTIGRALLPNNPLGFGNDASLALLEFNCPNNVAPVFWRKGTFGGRAWYPLFERAV